ncbi:MAG: hypothetical protein IKB72_00600 [Ruminococcus sp.]|nr:hypothetical protein [Ruminococcus sp.]
MNAKSKATVISLPIGAMLSEYDSLREQKKKIEDRMKYLADQIKANAEKVGVKDDKGSFYAEDEQFIYGKQCKKSVSFNQEKALSYFREHGYDDCITTVEVINEEAVEGRINTGDISFEDLEDITTTKVSYAIDLKRKEEMAEVEQTEVAMAASKKSRLVPKGGKK